jgi:hypothetical protein
VARKKTTDSPTRTEVPRWLRVKVSRDDIGKAIMAKSTGCAISDAIARTYPDIERPLTDIRSTRVTFPELGERAEYKMTLSGALFIVRFDRGDRDLDAFELRLPLVAHTPIRAATKAQPRKRAAAHAERQAKIDRGEPLTQPEKSAHTQYRGEDRPTTLGPATYESGGPAGTVQIGGPLSPVAAGASGPSIPEIPENKWGESGASSSTGRRPKHYRGYGVHGLGEFDPAVLETAGDTYGSDPALF